MPSRGRGHAPGTHGHLQRYTHNNGFALASQEVNLSVEASFEPALEGYPAHSNGRPRSSETYFSQPSTWGARHANGFPHSSDKHESGSVSPQLRGSPRTEVSNHPDQGISTSRASVPNTGIVTEEKSDSLSVADPKR